jgi:hypothetical protein
MKGWAVCVSGLLLSACAAHPDCDTFAGLRRAPSAKDRPTARNQAKVSRMLGEELAAQQELTDTLSTATVTKKAELVTAKALQKSAEAGVKATAESPPDEQAKAQNKLAIAKDLVGEGAAAVDRMDREFQEERTKLASERVRAKDAADLAARLATENDDARLFLNRIVAGWFGAGAGGGLGLSGPIIRWSYRSRSRLEVAGGLSVLVARGAGKQYDAREVDPDPTLLAATLRASHGAVPIAFTYGLGLAVQTSRPGTGWTVLMPQVGLSFLTATERRGSRTSGPVGEVRLLVTPWLPLARGNPAVFFGLEVSGGVGFYRGGGPDAPGRIQCGDD